MADVLASVQDDKTYHCLHDASSLIVFSVNSFHFLSIYCSLIPCMWICLMGVVDVSYLC